jgi:hypothetical protein
MATHLSLSLGLAELLHLAQTASLFLCGNTLLLFLLLAQTLALHLLGKTLQTLGLDEKRKLAE